MKLVVCVCVCVCVWTFLLTTRIHSLLKNLRWQLHWLPRLMSLPRKSCDWWRTRDSSLGQPTENKSWLKTNINILFHFFFYFIKSQTSDSFVNHFDGHFSYLKNLGFSFKPFFSLLLSSALACPCERSFIKMHCIGNSFVRTWKIHPLQACACVFSLEILPAGAVKGLFSSIPTSGSEWVNAMWRLPSPRTNPCLRPLVPDF